MVRQLAEWLAGRLHRAALLAAVMVVVPLTSALSAGVVAFVTLDRGARDGLVVAAGATAVPAVLILAQGGAWHLAVASLAMLFAPALGLGALLRATRSLALCLQAAVVAGLLLVAGMFVLMDDPLAFWQGIVDQWGALLEAAGAGPQWQESFAAAVPIMPGIFVSSVVLLMLTSLLIGRWLQAAKTEGIELAVEFRQLRLGYVLAGATTVAVVLALLGGGPLVQNTVPVLLTGCLLQGIAIVHAVRAAKQWHAGWLVLMYALLCLPTAPLVTLALIGLGYVDNWIDVRARTTRPVA